MIPITDRQRALREMGRTMTIADVAKRLTALEADIALLQPTPKPALLPCHLCGNPGIRNLGKDGYCSTHLTNLYSTFGTEACVDGGVGLQTGPLRPEYGPLEADLTCCSCAASWTGIPGDPCTWCQRSIQIQHDHQIHLLLTPPDVHPADPSRKARMHGWAKRLAIAVKAGIITQQQAINAGRSTDRRGSR